MSARKKVADYSESLEILTRMARGGDVRAAIALAGHLRKESGANDGAQRLRDELAARRTARHA